MLDDLKMIHNRDSQDALGVVAKQGNQLRHEFAVQPIDASGVTNIVYTGMGGSALAALLANVWPGVHLPFEIVRGYSLPAYVSASTLCIVSSYSGNTEETLSALDDAAAKGAKIVVISSGGTLAEVAQQQGYPLVLLPNAAQPRYAVMYNYRALLEILVAAGLLEWASVESDVAAAADSVDAAVQEWLPEVTTSRNLAKQIAQELMGQSVVIYGGPKLFPAVYKWKISCNENAKHIAWTGQYSEFNHNEFMGWTQQPVDKPYAVVDIRSNLEHPRIQKRFTLSKRLLSGKRPAPIVIEPQGETLIQQVVWASALGDFVTIYLALLSGIDPAPVDLIEKFKQELRASTD